MRGKRKVITVVLVLVVIAAIVCGVIFIPKWFSKSGTSAGKRIQMNTVTLEKTELTESVSATGTIGSAEIRLASAQVQDLKVKNVLVQVGDTVEKGQTLVTFNRSSLKKALKQAKEDYENAKSGSSSGVRTVTLGGSAGADSAGSPSMTFPTGTQAVTPSAVQPVQTTQPAVQPSQTTGQPSQAVGQSFNQQVLTGATQSGGNTSQVTQAKRALQEAKAALKNAVIKAPISGTVTALGVEKGSTYNGGDAVQISDLTRFQVSASVDEYDINKIEKGQRVVILTDATGDEEIEGEITYVALTTESSSLSVNTSSGGSGTTGAAAMGDTSGSGYAVTIALNQTDAKIRSGMTAKCSIITKEVTDIYAVPYDAIHTNSNGESYIIAMESGNRKEIVVEKGMESDYLVEVSSTELSDGMTVLIPSDEVSTGGDTDSGESDNSSSGLGGLMGGGAGGDMGGTPEGFSGGDFSPPEGVSGGSMPEPPSGGFPGGGANGPGN